MIDVSSIELPTFTNDTRSFWDQQFERLQDGTVKRSLNCTVIRDQRGFVSSCAAQTSRLSYVALQAQPQSLAWEQEHVQRLGRSNAGVARSILGLFIHGTWLYKRNPEP